MPQYNRAELGRMATESGFVRDTFEKVLRLKEYLDRFEEKKYMPELLFEDAEIAERVKNHPMALWKCKE
ncbi:hypothetical protein [Eubacterium ventriosum]|mgnify:FL=1|uniref:hypothetical protein n=1 Tax=Eubacterium ventriosum TaxID=39496 RepID=UPI002079E7F2|nr:hypothetical protein [Eubacterium ventriosum]